MPCSPGMARCARSCRHRALVTEYRSARMAGEQAREDAVGVYGEQSAEWRDYAPPPVVFKDWLSQTEGWGK